MKNTLQNISICNPVNPVWSVDCLLLKLLLIPNHIFIIHIDTKAAINPEPTTVHTTIELPHLLFLQSSFQYVCINFQPVFYFAPYMLIISNYYIIPT